jgi:predicted dehydrogenase
LIHRADVEAVLIATPHTWHALLALYAAQRGVHVLGEKPLAVSAAAADRVIATEG